MSSDLDTLLGMGFDKHKAELAVKESGGCKLLRYLDKSNCLMLISSAVQDALEWLEINQHRSHEEIVASSETTATTGDDQNAELVSTQAGNQARSLVCNECCKKFRSQAQAEFHASKTQHVDFAESEEEISALSQEEKKARLEELRQKLVEKRAGMSEQDKIDKKRNEVSLVRISVLILTIID